MRRTFLAETIALGAISGMRSMAGLATLALRRRGVPTRTILAMAVGEMIVDKTPLVGDRIAPMQLSGRMATGALVGGVVAHEARGNPLIGALAGAAAAVVAAHLAFHLRRRLPMSTAFGGMLEDAVVIGIGALAAANEGQRRELTA